MRIGKYLRVERLPDLPRRKTHRWDIYGVRRGELLGSIAWFGRWRQYTFNPASDTTFNHSCLTDIAEFLKNMNKEQR